MSLRHRFRVWRLARAQLDLEDRQYHLEKWGWAATPSRDVHERRGIARMERKVKRLAERYGEAVVDGAREWIDDR